jgi:hypothetical protein
MSPFVVLKLKLQHERCGAGGARLPEKTINKAQQLLRSRYSDFGPTLATEKLAIEGVSLSVETVRQLLMGEGLWKAKAVRRPVIQLFTLDSNLTMDEISSCQMSAGRWPSIKTLDTHFLYSVNGARIICKRGAQVSSAEIEDYRRHYAPNWIGPSSSILDLIPYQFVPQVSQTGESNHSNSGVRGTFRRLLTHSSAEERRGVR